MPTPETLLRSEYLRRRRKNPRYSLRAFAGAACVAPGRMSQYLSGKRRLTARMAQRVAEALALGPKDRQLLLTAAGVKEQRGQSAAGGAAPPESVTLRDDEFALIAEWYHFAILSLVKVAAFSPDPRWVAKHLGIDVQEAKDALARLIRLGLLAWDGEKLKRTKTQVTTSNGVPSAALRRSHKQTIEQAIAAIDTVSVDDRHVSSMTLAIDPARLIAAKDEVLAFFESMATVLETDRPSAVYSLNVQLIPISKSFSKSTREAR